MSRLHADIALLLAAIIWGVAFVFQKSAMADIGPLAFIASRGAVSGDDEMLDRAAMEFGTD